MERANRTACRAGFWDPRQTLPRGRTRSQLPVAKRGKSRAQVRGRFIGGEGNRSRPGTGSFLAPRGKKLPVPSRRANFQPLGTGLWIPAKRTNCFPPGRRSRDGRRDRTGRGRQSERKGCSPCRDQPLFLGEIWCQPGGPGYCQREPVDRRSVSRHVAAHWNRGRCGWSLDLSCVPCLVLTHRLVEQCVATPYLGQRQTPQTFLFIGRPTRSQALRARRSGSPSLWG